MSLSFNIHGVGLKIESSSPDLRDKLSIYLAPYSVVNLDNGILKKLTIQIHKSNMGPLVEIPSTAKRFFNYYGLIEGFEYESDLYFKGLDSVFELKPQSMQLNVSVSEMSLKWERAFTHVIFTLVLFEALRYAGLYYVHAASLLDQKGRGWVFSANQSSGKTTIAMALIKSGFKCLTDDAILIKRDDKSGLKFLAFERDFHVPLHVAKAFDELKPLENEPEYFPNIDKRGLNIDDVYPETRIAEMNAPNFLVFPEISERPLSSVKLITPLEAIKDLMAQSAYVFFSRSEAQNHLDILRDVVTNATCLRLFSGRDIYDDPVKGVARVIKIIEAMVNKNEF